jgi:DNA transposase THAP9
VFIFQIQVQNVPEILKLLSERAEHPKSQYPPELKSFALNLNYYSNSGYEFVRKTFNNLIPSQRQLQRWLAKIDGSPGFTEESLNLLNRKISQQASKNKRVAVALTMDEMYIRKHVTWDKNQNKFIGFVDFDSANDSNIVANKVLVFMVTAVNGNWKLPVGYFNVARLQTYNRADLLRGCLEFLSRVDIDIFSLTFDGDPSSMAAAEQFGIKFGAGNLCSTMINPTNGQPISVFLDMSHALKLVRNNFAKCGQLTFINSENEEQVIDWKHISDMEALQSSKGLHLGNRLTPQHIDFENEKMKVRLAAQLFSEGTASGLDYLRLEKYPGFEDSQPTSQFCRYINYIFDIFNSRTLEATHMKKPLSRTNKDRVFRYMDEVVDFIRKLRTPEGNLVITSSIKTGFLGIIMNIQSLKALYNR